MYSPSQHAKVFGTTFVRDYQERPLLVVGRDTWTRGDLAQMGITQMKACSILTSIAKALDAKSLADFYKNTSPYSFADYPAGVTTLYVLFACFAEKDLDVNRWYMAGKEHALTTFEALKQREAKARARERADTKRRKRSSRRQTHEGQVKQFMKTVNGN